jgi:hypothetical protein
MEAGNDASARMKMLCGKTNLQVDMTRNEACRRSAPEAATHTRCAGR